MSELEDDIKTKALKKLIEYAEETTHCGVCGGHGGYHDQVHETNCPVLYAVKALAADEAKPVV